MSEVIIGIPVRNDLESFKATINSILNTTQCAHEIVIIESDSDDGTKEYCDWLVSRYFHIRVIHTDKEGPLRAYNRLFELAKKEKKDLLLSQSDVVFPTLYKRDWLYMLKGYAHGYNAVTTSRNGGGKSGEDYIDGFNWLGGWCTYIPLNILEAIGGYDKDFPNGFGVDIDWTYRVSQVYEIIYCDFWVDHHMMNQRTHDNDKNSEKMKKEASKYFKQKWQL